MSTAEPIAVTSDGHRTRLKWHRARKRSDDSPFTRSRIVEGMAVGASVEVDLVIHAPGSSEPCGFAILHDRDLAGATTGSGDVGAAPADYLRSLTLRDNDGRRIDEPVTLLGDLGGALADIHPNAVLQLDLKQSADDLDEPIVRSFAEAVAPFAEHAILSCGDAEAVRILTDAVPRLRVGYDPCHHGAVDRALRWRTYRRFVDHAVAASPRAEVIYLDRRLVLTVADRGTDLVAAFHATGREIDIYTFGRDDPDIDRALELRADQITTDDPQGVARRFGSATEDSGVSRP
ncbi:glycerophosphodiester phosphodiesterase [Gordonia sp. L191]|uniref:glycerophosphodiester phosphodiesterase n=1 Tax=Gordonia sp. L191 TaxID=2982699 RepID=UPI0024C0B737|nr:glycerophosphodiester phosphodiesterase family protein [Gordonia sp. L191]WHU47904.1 glycerophosphodiester phosphodiesterase [Gordonia sp. L191]